MSQMIIRARALAKRYKEHLALDHLDFDVPAGRIVGLIGPNGAGKTTALKAILGLTPYEGELEVLGLNPHKHRTELLSEVCFIADTAILPRWISVTQVLDYLDGVHRKFNRAKAEDFISRTSIKMKSKVGHLSKGMVTQLHLALVMAIDAKLLVLDEPTLGLDIVHRKDFYSALLSEYFDHEKTIIITTHQVEEIENILTDLMFIDQGELILNEQMDNIPERFFHLDAEQQHLEEARKLTPLYEQHRLGGSSFIFDALKHSQAPENLKSSLTSLGKVKIPSVADIFLAKIKSKHNGSVE